MHTHFHTLSRKAISAFAIAFAIALQLSGPKQSSAAGTAPAAPAQQPYASIARFRSFWAADTCSPQHGRSWDEYWYWVQKFYSGGWNALSDGLEGKIRDPGMRAKRAAELQLLGLRVSAEWSRAKPCRKIRTTTGLLNWNERGKPALSTWGNELRDAGNRDNGDGTAIGAAMDDVTRQVNAVLGPQ